MIRWPRNNNKTRRNVGDPICLFSYSVILRCFVVRIWFRLDSNRSLHEYIAMDLYPITEKDKEGMWTIHRVPIVEGHLTADVLSQYLQEILKTENYCNG